MENTLIKLKGDFNNIINIRNNVKNVFDILQVRIDKLRQIYSEFIKNNKNEMFVFGLDSFNFQSKLIDIEYDDMKRLFLAINNRMYCEYFKLHKIIVEYITKTISDKKSIDIVKINNYPTYKDLEPFREYKFEIILDIHENILNLLGAIISNLNNKENELMIHKSKQNIGLNIDNFITTFNFEVSVMREKITMFIAYIEFFHKMHSKYLKRFSNKIQLMYTHINNDIKFDDSIEISKNKKQELINDFLSNDVDKDLLKELKISIGSDIDSDDSSEISKKYSNNKNIVLEKQNIINLNQIEPKDSFKNIIKNNVKKVSNALNIIKTMSRDYNEIKSPIKVTNNITNDDINKIFSGINDSCDSVINSSESIDSNKDNMLIQSIELRNSISYDYSENKPNNEIDNIIVSKEEIDNDITKYDLNNNVIEENIIIKKETSQDFIEENDKAEEENDKAEEENDKAEEENDKAVEENRDDNQEIVKNSKKKRKYNKKKK
jgi:hypothetical protein